MNATPKFIRKHVNIGNEFLFINAELNKCVLFPNCLIASHEENLNLNIV